MRFFQRLFRFALCTASLALVAGAVAAQTPARGLASASGSAAPKLWAVPPPVPASVTDAFRAPPRKDCLDIVDAHRRQDNWFCDINTAAQLSPTFVLFGDSHGLQLLKAFEAAAGKAHRRGIMAGYSGCPPLLGVYVTGRFDQDKRDCNMLNKRVLEYVRSSGIRDVFLVAKWSYYTDFWLNTNYIDTIGLTPDEPRTVFATRRAFVHGVGATVQAYARDLGVRLYVLEQVPQQPSPTSAVYASAWEVPAAVDQRLADLSARRATHVKLQAFASSVFARFKDQHGFTILNADDVFCGVEICLVGTGRTTLYQDLSHLSAAGADRLVPMFTKLLKNRHK